MQENQSEVAWLRAQITLECEAIRRVLEEPACVASHAAIHTRYRNLGTHQSALESQVGEQEATSVLVEIYQQVVG